MTGIVGKCSMIEDTAFALVCFVQFPVTSGVREMCGRAQCSKADRYKDIQIHKIHKKS